MTAARRHKRSPSTSRTRIPCRRCSRRPLEMGPLAAAVNSAAIPDVGGPVADLVLRRLAPRAVGRPGRRLPLRPRRTARDARRRRRLDHQHRQRAGSARPRPGAHLRHRQARADRAAPQRRAGLLGARRARERRVPGLHQDADARGSPGYGSGRGVGRCSTRSAGSAPRTRWRRWSRGSPARSRPSSPARCTPSTAASPPDACATPVRFTGLVQLAVASSADVAKLTLCRRRISIASSRRPDPRCASGRQRQLRGIRFELCVMADLQQG